MTETNASDAAPIRGRSPGSFSVLVQYPKFRKLWIGLTVSSSGTWLRMLAASLLILEQTGSAAMVGILNLLGFLPIALFVLIGGQAVDRTSSRQVLIISQAISMCVSATLVLLTAIDAASPLALFICVFALGTTYAFTKPAAQALLPQLVSRESLPDAIAVNALQFTLGLVFGPLSATFLIQLLGFPAAFVLDAASFGVLLLVSLNLPSGGVRATRTPASTESSIREGVRFVRGERDLVILLTALACATVGIEVVKTLMPLFATGPLSIDAESAGILISLYGLGTLSGVFLLPRVRSAFVPRLAVSGGLLLQGVSVIAFSSAGTVWAGIPLLVMLGFAHTVSFSLITATFFQLVPTHLRGRALAIHSLSFLGISPFAALMSGMLSEYVSVTVSGMFTGIFPLIGSIVIATNNPFHRRFDGRGTSTRGSQSPILDP